VLAEWTVGLYEQQVALPQPVNGALTNATYENGILLLAMPKLTAGQRVDHVEFHLQALDATHGER
jgi:HSP20 family molecular chaperone IbpA